MKNSGMTMATWIAIYRAGHPLASSVYLHYLHAKDLTNGNIVIITGKFFI